MLTTEQMQKITKEAILGMTPTIRGPEADDFRESIIRDIAKARKRGMIIDIPQEWPDMDTPDESTGTGA